MQLFQLTNDRVKWGMIVEDDDICGTVPQCNGLSELADKTGSITPLAEVHDHDSDNRSRRGRLATR
jgi:hypothetical protein